MTTKFYVILRTETRYDKEGKVMHVDSNIFTGQRIFATWGKAHAYQQEIIKAVLKNNPPDYTGIYEKARDGREKATYAGVSVVYTDGSSAKIITSITQVLLDD